MSTTFAAIVSVCIKNNNPITTAFATSLYFKLFNFLKDVLLQFAITSLEEPSSHLLFLPASE
jgi:hypothetical protein